MSLLLAAAFLLGSLVLPGLLIQRLCRVRPDPALVLPLGTAFVAAAYFLALRVDQPWLFPALGALAVLTGLARRPVAEAAAARAQRPGPSLLGAVPAALVLVVLFALTQYPWNRIDRDGALAIDPLVPYDSTFHVGVTHELTFGWPPQVPGLAGFPLEYHFGTDLVRAAALRWGGIDPWDAISRLDVTLGAFALVLLLRAILFRADAPPAAVRLAPWTLLLTDFSFLFGASPQAHWWADLLRGNLLYSLFLANPVVPALALALGSLLCLQRHRDGEGPGFLVLAVAQAAAVPFFKVFLGAHLLVGLAAAAWADRARGSVAPDPARGPGKSGLRGGLPFVLAALPCAFATAALAWGPGTSSVEVALSPFDLARVTRESLGLAPLAGAALAGWTVLWTLASLGLRTLGLPSALRALAGGQPLAAALAAMALVAWPLALLFRVQAAEVLPELKPINDVAYLLEQGGPLLWLFTAVALARFARTPARRITTAVAVVALALPATLQFVVKKRAEPPLRLPAARVRAMQALAAVSHPGEIVLQRAAGQVYPPAPVLWGRRVPYERFTPYPTQFASKRALEERHRTVYRFFETRDRAEAIALARTLGAGYLALYDHDRVRFPADGMLEPVFEEPGARVYRLRLPPG